MSVATPGMSCRRAPSRESRTAGKTCTWRGALAGKSVLSRQEAKRSLTSVFRAKQQSGLYPQEKSKGTCGQMSARFPCRGSLLPGSDRKEDLLEEWRSSLVRWVPLEFLPHRLWCLVNHYQCVWTAPLLWEPRPSCSWDGFSEKEDTPVYCASGACLRL